MLKDLTGMLYAESVKRIRQIISCDAPSNEDQAVGTDWA
jgi:hypothetical protein